jgi:two-component system OmpR family sensor kinase
MKPIREISQTADSFTADNMSGRLTVPGGDEFGQLANTINGMLDRVESAFSSQRIALEKVESVLKQQRRFTADASHELKTPLAVIKANTGLMIHSMKLDEDATQTVEAIDLAATRMNRLVQDLMVLSRTEAGQSKIKPSPVHLGEIVASAVRSVNRPNAPTIELIGAREDLIVTGLVPDLERVFVNLVDNACRHTAPDGKVRVEIRQLVDRISVEVTDTGEGIAPEHLEHIFDRFYRVDSSRSSESGGTGLGLAICKSIV